jgi:pyruvate/2-oxoglutarate dehydrogenase complex dihydrolipoamide acyltransferase (E2) component
VPKPRVNLTRFHGVFAPNSAHRARVTKAGRGKGASAQAAAETDDRTPAGRRAAMSWARRLKRVFGIDIETCRVCGGAMRIIACIEDPVVIEKILAHLGAKAATAQPARPPPCRAPPARSFG